jgi:SAM-dependent methyltransferase
VDTELAMLGIARAKLACAGDRARVVQADLASYEVPPCELVVSSLVFHHVPPDLLRQAFSRIGRALTAGGAFILFDHMLLGSPWSDGVSEQNRRLQARHVARALAEGQATQAELDAREAFKRKMRDEGKDAEYRHRAEALLDSMRKAGFAEASVVWQLFSQAIIIALRASSGGE